MMDLELIRKKTEMIKCIYRDKKIYEETAEMIVPDNSPDILRIVKGHGNVFLKDKNAMNGKINISGSINGIVLYIAEGETCIRKIRVNIPFSNTVDGTGVTEDSKISASIRLRGFDVKEINPRKISVRASVEAEICLYEKNEINLCEAVRDCEKYGICIRKKSVESYFPSCICEKSFVIGDDIELSSPEQDMKELVMSSVNVAVNDVKQIGSKMIVKGNVEISYVYELENGEIEASEKELPFSQIIDMEECDEENVPVIKLTVSGYELEPQYDGAGKARFLGINVSVDAIATGYVKTVIDAVDDAYSTKHSIDITREKKTLKKLCNKIEKRVATTESIETGNGIMRVLDLAVELPNISRRREEGGELLAGEAAVSVLYMGEDNQVYNAQRRIPVVCPIPLSESSKYETLATVRGKSYSVGTGNDINVRFFTDFEISEIEDEIIETVSALTLSEDERSYEKIPSLTVKRLERDFDIWSLAKENSTTVEEIKLANGINDEASLCKGRIVLIPRKG